ncbi:hypothetical protein Pint_00939 [Pistacia integerrima]|uniref:Uncharacterized protein n=1 Tax=Pistacia integerrima TaxID=434235 RepID=A0ACC0ZJN8_9ROSI|nr:hypothetical protein Pint_00939 [Pistacia integerrima]
MTRKRGENKLSVLVVLEGIKASKDRTGIAPLCKAMREVNNDEDEILVLTILPAKEESATGTSSDVGNSECGPDHHHLQCNQSWGQDSYINFLRQEITQKMEVYRRTFRPFYDTCKTNGVKIAACFRLKDIIIEEVNNAKATWIFMDRYFTRDLSFRLSGTECNVSLIGDDDEPMVPDHLLLCDGSECSMVVEERLNPKSPKPMNGSTQQEPCINCSLAVLELSSPSLASTRKERGKQKISEPQEQNKNVGSLEPLKEEITPHDDTPIKHADANMMLGVPVQLSWEEIMDITSRFSTKFCARQKNYMTYTGYLTQQQKYVLVKRFTENSSGIFQAENKAASSIHHKNIMQLLAYHKSDTTTVLLYPLPREGTLDDILSGLGEYKLKLKFQQKLKIAIGIAQGVRYMHEECPRGPVAHGQLQLINVFLRYDLEPLVKSQN